MALYERERSKKGQKIDVAMLDCQVSILENALARYFATGTSPKPAGNKHNSIVPFETFTTSDGTIMIAAGNDRLFKKLLHLIKRDDLIEDERFITNAKRNENYEELKVIIEQQTQKESTDYWYKLLIDEGVPCGPINTIERLTKDKQVLEREMIVDVEHPTAGVTKLPGLPIKMSRTAGTIKSPAPLLGADTYSVLHELGYTDEAIKQLEKDAVI